MYTPPAPTVCGAPKVSSTEPHADHAHHGSVSLPLLTIAALGVIYGDIGTSPLYAMQVALSSAVGVQVTHDDIYGLVSLFVWTLTIIVTIKYVLLVMRANNNGEGGDLALKSLALRFVGGRTRALVVVVGTLAVALFSSDAVLTPSISVLSAVEGAAIEVPAAAELSVEIAIAIITGLFLMQRYGTARVGTLFGPIMVVWFATIGVLGLRQVLQHPEIVAAVSPTYAAAFIVDHPGLTFVALSAVTLAVTGAEALYADMGHFGRPPIAISWLCIVFPALILCYLGQAGMVLANPSFASNPFFFLAPSGLVIPLVVLATLATVIASQAVISGAYSVARQAMQLGLLPRMRVVQTSVKVRGQIFIPAITVVQFAAVIATVLIFQSSAHLAAAYGFAVTGTFCCTTTLAAIVAKHNWGWASWKIVAVFTPLAVVDVSYFAANVSKIPHGAWFSLILAAILYTLMWSWSTSRQAMLRSLSSEAVDVDEFAKRVASGEFKKTEGTGVFLVASPTLLPRTLLAALRNFGRIHETTILLTIQTLDTPFADAAERCAVEELAPGMWRVYLRFGFAESPDVPHALAASPLGDRIEVGTTSYFVGRDTVAVTTRGLRSFPRRVFAILHRHAQVSTDFFRVPPDHTITMGARVEI